MKKDKEIFYGWWIVLASVLVSATMVPSVMAMANKFLIPVTEEMRISRSAFTLSNSILQAMGIIFAPFITKKLAQGNLKKIQRNGIIVFGLTFMTYGLAQRPIHLYITSFVLGIAFLTAAIIPISLMITNWFKEKRGLAMSMALSGIGLGGFIFSPLLTKWIANYGWRKSYMIFGAIIILVSLPMSLFIFEKSPEDKGLKALGSDQDKKESKTQSSDLRISVKESFKKPFFKFLLLGMILNGIINTGALGQFPPALEELHGPATAAKIISLYSLIGIFGKLLLGWVNDKYGVMKGTIFGSITFALAFVAILFGENIAMVYLMALLFGLGNAIGNVLPPLLTSAIYGQEKYGEVYGYINSASQIGLTLGSLIVASIYDASGSYRLAWIIMTVATLFTMINWILAYKKSLKYRENN